MFYAFLYPLASEYKIFNLFKYLSFRTGGALFTALLISFLIGPKIIRWLKSHQGEGQPIREDGPESHLLTKKGTPTMGGLMILISMLTSAFLWGDWTNRYLWAVVGIGLFYALIGFSDDYLKLKNRSSNALSGKLRLFLEFSAAFAGVWFVSMNTAETYATMLTVPFLKKLTFDLGVFYIPFAMFVIVGTANAVNLTDGLDGLTIMPSMIVSFVFMIIAYMSGNVNFSAYLQIPHLPATGELAVFCGALIGSGMGFLWFNAPPAKVFMGDTGSLALGGILGMMSVITKHEIVLAIAGDKTAFPFA